MKKILIALLALTMCFSLVACGNQDAKSSSAIFSLEELVNDPEFRKIFADDEDEVFKYSVSSEGNDVFVFRVDAKKHTSDPILTFSATCPPKRSRISSRLPT